MEIFNRIEFIPDWGVILGLISVTTIIVGGLRRLLKDPEKSLAVREVIVDTFLNKPGELANNIRILLDGQEIVQLTRMTLYLKNEGRKALHSSDYHVLPTVNLSGFTNIVSINISATNEFTTCESNQIDQSHLELKIDNFESHDYIKLEVLFESISDDFESYFEFRLKENKHNKTDLKEYRLEKGLGISKDYNALMMLPIFAALIAYGATYILVRFGLGVNLTDQEFGIGWKSLFYAPAVVTGLSVLYSFKKTIDSFHYGHKKINDWHYLALGNPQ